MSILIELNHPQQAKDPILELVLLLLQIEVYISHQFPIGKSSSVGQSHQKLFVSNFFSWTNNSLFSPIHECSPSFSYSFVTFCRWSNFTWGNTLVFNLSWLNLAFPLNMFAFPAFESRQLFKIISSDSLSCRKLVILKMQSTFTKRTNLSLSSWKSQANTGTNYCLFFIVNIQPWEVFFVVFEQLCSVQFDIFWFVFVISSTTCSRSSSLKNDSEQ